MDKYLIIDIDLLAICIILVVLFSLSLKKDKSSFSSRIFKFWAWFVLGSIVLEIATWLVDGMAGGPGVRSLVYWLNILLLMVVPTPGVVWLCYLDYQIFESEQRLRKRWFYSPIVIVQMIAVLALIPTDFFFHINDSNEYVRGVGIYVSTAINFFVIAYPAVLIFQHRHRIERIDMIVLTSFAAIPLIGASLQMLLYGSLLIWVSHALVILISHVFLENRRSTRELERANQELQNLNLSLEEKVEERTAQLAAMNSQQKSLLHVLCHDLLGPFSNIRGILEVSQFDPGLLEDNKDLLLLSANNGLQQIQLVRKLEALEEGKLDITLEPFNLKELVLESEQLINRALNEKNIALKVDVPDHETVQVEKVSFVNTVLMNILSNAVKFSYENSEIRITCQKEENRICLLIVDQGLGIPAKLQDHLFDLTRSTSRKGTLGEIGTGFGMPLVERFMKAYGGSIEIQSLDEETHPKHHGTTVKLWCQQGSSMTES